jgi:hypothetical protein
MQITGTLHRTSIPDCFNQTGLLAGNDQLFGIPGEQNTDKNLSFHGIQRTNEAARSSELHTTGLRNIHFCLFPSKPMIPFLRNNEEFGVH